MRNHIQQTILSKYMNCSWLHFLWGIGFSCLIFMGCSKNLSYEDQISNILVYEEGVGEYTNEQFEKAFKLIEENPNTIDYKFPEMNSLKIVTSDDENIRAYIVERCGFGGNTSNAFDTRTLIQYRIGEEIYSTRLHEDYASMDKITKISDDHYLFIDSWGVILSGSQNHDRARVFRIDDGGLIQVPSAFNTSDGYCDELVVNWVEGHCEEDDNVYTELIDKYGDELLDGMIYYNVFDNTLYVANTITSSMSHDEILTGTFSRYLWGEDNLEFVDSTIMFPVEFQNDKFFIRIEQDSDGYCTYKCWNGGKKTGNPTLTIGKGKREIWDEIEIHDFNKWISSDEYKPLGERYTFENNGYKYQYMSGWLRGRTYEDLEVYNPKGDLVYSGHFKPVE